MSPAWRRILIILLALIGIGIAWQAVLQNGASAAVRTSLLQSPADPPLRERDGPSESPLISFIDSPSAECYRPVANTDACYITWSYIYVTATSPQYIISSTVAIDGRLRAYVGGFFQSYMYIPGDMLGKGFRVACGLPGSGGNPNLGKSYGYVLRARETGGLSAANYGAVLCPADSVSLAAVDLSGPANGFINTSYLFTAQADPITATLPITYVWEASGQAPLTITNGPASNQAFTWATPGAQAITLTVSNPSSSITAWTSINIHPFTIYLPRTVKRR